MCNNCGSVVTQNSICHGCGALIPDENDARVLSEKDGEILQSQIDVLKKDVEKIKNKIGA